MGCAAWSCVTGGWRPFDEESVARRGSKPPPFELSSEEREVDAILAVWARVGRARRDARRLLRAHGLKLVDWQVLRATRRLVLEMDDVVSQQAVARRAGLREGPVSTAMKRLFDAALVDIAPDAWGWSLRVLVTKEGEKLLAQIEPRLLQVLSG